LDFVDHLATRLGPDLVRGPEFVHRWFWGMSSLDRGLRYNECPSLLDVSEWNDLFGFCCAEFADVIVILSILINVDECLCLMLLETRRVCDRHWPDDKHDMHSTGESQRNQWSTGSCLSLPILLCYAACGLRGWKSRPALFLGWRS